MTKAGCILAGALTGCNPSVVTGPTGTGGASASNAADAATQVSSGAMGGVMEAPIAPPRVLLFTKTAGYRHASISDAVQGVGQTGFARGWSVDHTEDATEFSDAGLASYDVVVFLLTSGDVLDGDQQAAFQSFVNAGGGYVGVHSASDTHYAWPWYGALVGSYIDTHWGIVETRLLVEAAEHPSSAHLGADWLRTDEWYKFQTNPRGAVNVLLTIDTEHYAAQGAPPEVRMDGDHPIAWYHEFDGGRAFYTALGHTADSYAEPRFLEHLAGGAEWAAGHDVALSP